LTAPLDLRHARLRNQRLSGPRFATPEEVVSWMGAVQAQEYGDAQWGLAIRTRGVAREAIERACDEGRILRTHVLRPTWHFVAPADIRWMLALTAPYISKRMAPYNRQIGLDLATLRKSQTIMARVLRGGRALTRQELKAALHTSGIGTAGVQRLAHIVMQAELDALICSGPRRGKHSTYALLDERVPPSPPLSREAALIELARRYFSSHGPAQLRDFVWWSGLPVGEARTGLAMLEQELTRDDIDGTTYWSAPRTRLRQEPSRTYLLPVYDEYLIAYKDRSAAFDRSRAPQITQGDPFSAPIVVDGIVVGAWRRRFRANTVVVTITRYSRSATIGSTAIRDAACAYAAFVGLELELCS
jgi:hypothetical protein